MHEGWKLIRVDQPEKQSAAQKKILFKLADDPTEQTNLAALQPEKVAELEALLDAHNAEQSEPLWASVIQAPQLIDKTTTDYEDGDVYLYWPN